MKIFYYSSTLQEYLKNNLKTVGFVPTMGALHSGHIALVKEAKSFCDCVAVSIFVNPKQFNNAADLEKYPKTPAEDLKMLHEAGADIVFIPISKDIFRPSTVTRLLDFAPLDTRFEGKYRPGHFEGVVSVLSSLFDILQPNHVFFGLKDLQQCLVIEKLIHAHYPQIVQHNCEIVRETSGLAKSSRNRRLSDKGRVQAAGIYKELERLKTQLGNFNTEMVRSVTALKAEGIDTEYLEWVKLPDMDALTSAEDGRHSIVFAGYVEGVRLIDNVTVI